MQFFKGDDTEVKFYNSGLPILNILSTDKNEFLSGAYSSGPLGDLLFDNNRSPLANAIPREIFRQAFKEIFEAFVAVGTFEAYLTVFRKIFGDTVVVEFVVIGPGHLEINIEAEGVELSKFISRYIADNAYFYDYVIDDEDDNIVFQTIKGFQSQYELEQMLFEMVPAGIFTEITLDLGV